MSATHDALPEGASVVRVRPDIAALNRDFDYAIPASWQSDGTVARLEVGSLVRIQLHGRRLGGWIVGSDSEASSVAELLPLKKWSGFGPDSSLVQLADWVAHRWSSNSVKVLRAMSPRTNVYDLDVGSPRALDRSAQPGQGNIAEPPTWAMECFEQAVTSGEPTLVRLAPGSDRWPIVLAALGFNNPLLLTPTVETASALARRLRRRGVAVAEYPQNWSEAASGAVTVGARGAVLARVANLGAIVVFDEHDSAYRETRTPTWHARDVAVERARRAKVPCVLVSPAPSLDALKASPLVVRPRSEEHAGWPTVQIIDRRVEPPGRLGLFSQELTRALVGTTRVAVILNRVGRVRLLACASCGELTTCEKCSAAMSQVKKGEGLVCRRCEHRRPVVCADCGNGQLKNLVLAVGRAREELEALIGEPVGEHTAASQILPNARVVIGTEALLRARSQGEQRYHTVCFLDFDQHLGAWRSDAESEALALLIMAARHVGHRRAGGRVVIQTREPDHKVLLAAARADMSSLASELMAQARELRWPPSVASAKVSGAGAHSFIDQLGSPIGVDIAGPVDDRWLIRSDDLGLLLEQLRIPDRSRSRLRIEVH